MNKALSKKIKQANPNSTFLIIAASEQDANVYWATHFLAPDPIIFIQHKKKKYLILNDLEVDRGRQEAHVDQVLSFTELFNQTPQARGRNKTTLDMVVHFLKKIKSQELWVPESFPIAYAEGLKKRKVSVKIKKDPFFEERLIKTTAEKNAIKKTLKFTSIAIQEAYAVLKASKIKGNKILYRGKPLTSEALRQVINLSLMKNNCIGKHTITAGGKQSVDPHCEGSGPLKAHQPIIMDVFPKSMDTQYFGDMTRTVVKGKASDRFHHQWHTVKKAQETGIKMVKAGVDGYDIHEWINQYFIKNGYPTGTQDGRMQGFFHGTGHGLGLDIHEEPRVSKTKHILKEGHVITIEPGLYYLKSGGVRLEDVVYVTKSGCEVLSRCPKILEIA